MLVFAAGIAISCLVFIVSLSRIPLAELATDLSLYTSSIVRPERAAQMLRSHGTKTRLYRLGGYLFFGSASRIDAVFAGVQQAGTDEIEGVVMDFTNVSGIDSSAIGVFQRMLRRYRGRQTRFYFIPAPDIEQSLYKIAAAAPEQVQFFCFGGSRFGSGRERYSGTLG